MIDKTVHCLFAADLVAADPPKRQRRPRKPRLAAVITEAERSGKNVTSVTTADGVVLHFEQESKEAVNPWLAEMEGRKQ